MGKNSQIEVRLVALQKDKEILELRLKALEEKIQSLHVNVDEKAITAVIETNPFLRKMDTLLTAILLDLEKKGQMPKDIERIKEKQQE